MPSLRASADWHVLMALVVFSLAPQETIAVMTGSELTAAELLKIDKTKLAEVVEEEKDAAAAAPSTEQPMREETKVKLQELSDQLQEEDKTENPPKVEESPRQAPVDLPAEPTEAKPDEPSPAVRHPRRTTHNRTRRTATNCR